MKRWLALLRAGSATRPRKGGLPMPIVVGSPRSGTTLLRLLLDAHPNLAIPPETGFLGLASTWLETGCAQLAVEQIVEQITAFPPDAPAWQDFGLSASDFRHCVASAGAADAAAIVRTFYRMYAERFGKSRWGDKTPLYCLSMPEIEALLPEARFIHIIRDGRDVALSLRPRFFSPGYAIEVQAEYWRNNVEVARAGGGRCRHYLEVRYETLLSDTETVLRQICEFVELDFDRAMLRAHERAPERLCEHLTRYRRDGSVLVSHEERIRQQQATMRPPDCSRIGVWRQGLTTDEIVRFEHVAGPLLGALGYALLQGKKIEEEKTHGSS